MLIIDILWHQSTDKLFSITVVPLVVTVQLHMLTNCTESKSVDSSYYV